MFWLFNVIFGYVLTDIPEELPSDRDGYDTDVTDEPLEEEGLEADEADEEYPDDFEEDEV